MKVSTSVNNYTADNSFTILVTNVKGLSKMEEKKVVTLHFQNYNIWQIQTRKQIRLLIDS